MTLDTWHFLTYPYGAFLKCWIAPNRWMAGESLQWEVAKASWMAGEKYGSKYIKMDNWLVVWTPLTNIISQLGWLFPIYGKMKNVPNHQPDKNDFGVPPLLRTAQPSSHWFTLGSSQKMTYDERPGDDQRNTAYHQPKSKNKCAYHVYLINTWK